MLWLPYSENSILHFPTSSWRPIVDLFLYHRLHSEFGIAAHEGLLPAAALSGGMIVILADFLGRVLFAPVEIPCGVITAMIGAPYFLYLLYRNRN
ncbi:MAG: iron chelate uptake ABC transporter family permease subunit [Cyanothece sp. SIO1E1]|nr:iron chelate uptake ABC transporter family permease subunit [Cyanothece sp. SIO1E1]